MKVVWRLLGGLIGLALILALGLAAPVAYVEFACTERDAPQVRDSVLPERHRRAAARTLLTYPEWHIVHAYDDYARVIRTGDPDDFQFGRAVAGYWSSLCALRQASGGLGGMDAEARQLVYTIGVSFSAEMIAKAAYEETLGRLAAWLRGPDRAVLDELSAQQATDYAAFLRQTPWYKWDFRADAEALSDAAGPDLRDRERALALGLEYRAKAAYAGVIEQAVADIGPDALTMRSVVIGATVSQLSRLPGVNVVGTSGRALVIETPRYRAFTDILQTLAERGVGFLEIAGNDRIMLSVIGPEPVPGAVLSLARQGADDRRHLVLVPVTELTDRVAELADGPHRLEHVYDY